MPPLSFRAEWERADPDARLLDHHDGAPPQWFFDGRKICMQQFHLRARTSIGSTPEQDNGGLDLTPQCQNGGEIGVGRNEDAVLCLGGREYLIIICRLHRKVADMDSIVAVAPQLFGKLR